MRRLANLSVLLCSLALLVAGCGGGDNAAPAEKDAASTNGSSASEATAGDDSPQTPVADVDTTDDAGTDTVPMRPSDQDAADDDAEYAESDVELEWLTVGSPAPPLKIDSWVMGDAVEGFKPGQVYVVEFWATWCPPCKASMPHLSQLQEEYGDQVRMIGVTDESKEVVEGFLDEEQSADTTWRDAIKYTLAIDDGQFTNTAYMQAARQRGIPAAFVVGTDGVIEWIGHPMAMDEPLAQIVGGDWDRAAAIAEFEEQMRGLELQERIQESMSAINAAARKQEWDEALGLVDELLAEPDMTPDQSAQLAGFKVSLLYSAGRTDEAMTLVDEQLAESESLQLSLLKLSILQTEGRMEEAAQFEAEVVEQNFDHPQLLNQIAWSITERDEHRDLELAMKAATRAAELTDEQDASILDTLASVHYERGDLDEAITWQKKAVAMGSEYPELAERLEGYETEKKSAEGGDSKSPVAAPRPDTF